MNNVEIDQPAILLLAHGSRAIDANAAMQQVVEALKQSGQYYAVECAFLEINDPDIKTGLTLCQKTGATRIIVVPYFLHLGRHVKEDLPRIIGEWQQEYPSTEVVVGQSLGFSPKI